MTQTAYLGHPRYLDELERELGAVIARHGRLLLAPGPPRAAAWAQNVWLDTRHARIASIGEGARLLRALQRNWVAYAPVLGGRVRLLAGALPYVAARPVRFPEPAPAAPLGSFTLLSREDLLYSARGSSPFPHGEARFVEDHRAPPNRAYLKLWEAFTWLKEHPRAGETCVDLGSAPGGWTWALATLGARVISVDKAPLAPEVAALPGVEFLRQSAFAIHPDSVGSVAWLVCDVACYPARLLGLLERWLAAGTAERIVATVKLQGSGDPDALRALGGIPGARIRHLWHNRHELTWAWRA